MPRTPLYADDPARVARFRLTERLGSGGMGVVYLGVDETDRQYAIKVIRSDFAADPEFRERFRREVVAARAVNGVCTARLVDADPDAPAPWLATEYIQGRSLSEAVAADGPFDEPMVRSLAVGLAEALNAIHGAGVVHRDLKPANVILAPRGPRVIDFGVAGAVDSDSSTVTGVMMGSPGYMAPEQVTGESRVGPPADIFAWGLTVLFAATGRPPFGTGRPDAVLYRVVHEKADLGALPPDLVPVVRDALHKDPAQRPDAAKLWCRLVPADDPSGHTRRLLSDLWLVAVPPACEPVPQGRLSRLFGRTPGQSTITRRRRRAVARSA